MKVRNRDGVSVDVSYDEIKCRIKALCEQNPEMRELDVDQVIIRTIQGIYDGITTTELDDLSAQICVSLQTSHHAYDTLAGCILMSNLHKSARHLLKMAAPTFSAKIEYIAANLPGVYVSDFLAFVRENAAALDATVDYGRDMRYNYFSVRTMENGYLMKVKDVCVESPQDMWMRVSIAVNCPRDRPRDSNNHRIDPKEGENQARLDDVRRCYDAMSTGLFTHATPTLFNAGTKYEQMSSCYLVGTDDSLDGIYRTISNCAQISKWAGGIGVHISNVRAKGSRIKSTNGTSDGVVPMLKVYNETARYCNQSGRRKGSICAYLEPWHADVWDFVELRKNTGAETERTRDLFLALWVPDLFMRCVVQDADWYLMTPSESPGLQDVYGAEFDALYAKYVAEGKYVKRVSALRLWHHVLQCQLETGTPYVLFKDSVNDKCNQKNLGTIRSSNLCAEITEYSDSSTYAVCNLASIAVNRFIVPAADIAAESEDNHLPRIRTRHGDYVYDHGKLHGVAKMITRNLNRLIDANFYPTPETRQSNMDARPIGIGVQGLADLYCTLGLPYDSEEALAVDAAIMETIYHGALESSVEMAKAHGPYPRFAGSPFSEGKLQMDLWNEAHDKRARLFAPTVVADDKPDGKSADMTDYLKTPLAQPVRYSGLWDWDALRAEVVKHGTRNSMLTALMPTASTSQILGNSECFEPPHSNVFKRTTLAGQFMVVNKVLMTDLMKRGLWSEELVRDLVKHDGCLERIPAIPADLREVHKRVWEIPQKHVMNHAVARAPFVDQSQSMNLFFDPPNSKKLSSALIYAWRSGLKTGLYYLRSNPAAEATKITSSGPSAAVDAGAASPSETGPDNGGSRQQNASSDSIGPACSIGAGGCDSCGA